LANVRLSYFILILEILKFEILIVSGLINKVHGM